MGSSFTITESKFITKIPVSGSPFYYSTIFNTADSWKPYVEAYSKQFRTIAVDMMGHGRSDIYNKDDINFRHGDYAKMILALLDSLKLYKVNAIGASSGGTTLHYLNTMQPDRFKSVITVGSHIYYSKRARDWITETGLNQFMEFAKHHGPEKQAHLARVFWEGRKLYGDASFTPDILNTIKAKWLVVLGDNDFAIPVQLGIEMYQNIPNSRLWIVPNGGHFPHLDAGIQPEFLRISLEFLTGKFRSPWSAPRGAPPLRLISGLESPGTEGQGRLITRALT